MGVDEGGGVLCWGWGVEDWWFWFRSVVAGVGSGGGVWVCVGTGVGVCGGGGGVVGWACGMFWGLVECRGGLGGGD